MAEPTVASLGEVRLIQRLSRLLPRAPRECIGIGDDAAVLPWTPTMRLLFASDLLVEGTHVPRLPSRASAASRGTAQWIGWKALARNISDIAAMGGTPTAAVVSLGLPSRTPVRFVEEVYRGLSRCARRFGVAVVGGDTVRAPVLIVDVAILGVVSRTHLVLRSGAKVGDHLFVTGRLGGSLRSGAHARFVPRLAQAQWLVRHLPIHAMIDLSDGLASDAWQLARASRVTIQLRESAIPVSRAGRTTWHALMDGEDFELLFAMPPAACRRVPSRIAGVPVTEVGTVTARGADVQLLTHNGRLTRLLPAGFRHF